MRRPTRRGVSPIIAQVMIVALTVVGGATLWAFRPSTPPQPSSIDYFAKGGQSEETWGDGSDCNQVNGVQSCLPLTAIDITLTGWSPGYLAVGSVTFYLICNGTVYLKATLAEMEWVPGSSGTPNGNAPQLGHCGNFVPPAAAFNRLAFFDQIDPGSKALVPGDQVVLFQPFEPPNCPSPKYQGGVLVACDDDFHGAPQWCFTAAGACSVEFEYTGTPSGVLTVVPLQGLGQ